MAQYDVFRNPEGSGYLLDVQSDLLDGLSTRLVIPLLPALQAPRPAARLNPVVNIKDEAHVMATQFIAAVPVERQPPCPRATTILAGFEAAEVGVCFSFSG